MNHAFLRARKAWESQDVGAYQKLARLQADLGADYLTLNLDGTQALSVRPAEMLALLPDLIPAIQEVTNTPLSFDNPSVDYHEVALAKYDRARSGRPILNSIAASRPCIDEMIELARIYDTMVVVMASEKQVDGGSSPCATGEDVHCAAAQMVALLREKGGRSNDQIIIDPGLAPVAADTYGLINIGLDGMRLIRKDPDLAGVHLSVGLTNFSFGLPREIRTNLENAYVTLALDAGLDYVLGNPEKGIHPLDSRDPLVLAVAGALEAGRRLPDEPQDEAGYRQAERIMELYS
jgi:5-methyltetrahydrofolate--homocysteine methyltransferase